MSSGPFIGQPLTDIVGFRFETASSPTASAIAKAAGCEVESTFKVGFANAASGIATQMTSPSINYGLTAKFGMDL